MNDKIWLIGMDMTISDHALLNNVRVLANKLKPEKIHFLYVHKKADIPEFILTEIPDLNEPEISQLKEVLQQKIAHAFDSEVPYEYEIVEGNPLSELLRYCGNKNVDLVIVGKKTEEIHTGTIFRKLARKAPCSVLLIPDRPVTNIDKIFVPVDFSMHARKAVNTAVSMAESFNASHIECLHVFKDAEYYLSQTLYTTDEVDNFISKKAILNRKLFDYAKHLLNDFVGIYTFSTHIIYRSLVKITKGQTLAEAIIKSIRKSDPDLVIVGAKGKSTAPAFLLGGVSEAICRADFSCLLMVKKKKGENSGLLEALISYVKS